MIKIINCKIHGPNSLINQIGDCKKCSEIEWQKHKAIEDQQIFLQRQEIAHIPKKYRKASFETYIPQNSKAQEHLDFCKNYDFNGNILFLGKTGTGKTHLACSLLNKAVLSISSFYTKFYNLADLKIHERTEFKKLLNYDFLVIDEYGQQANDFKSNLLFEIIDQRQDNSVSTVLISNLGVIDGKDKFRESISDQLYSRFKENYSVKACNWEDYRLNKKEMEAKSDN